MEVKDLLQIFMMSEQNIDSLWEFFVAVHLGIFGAIFVLHRLATYQLSMLMFSYTMFLIINTRAKIKEYDLYFSIIDDIKVSAKNNSKITSYFLNYDATDRISITITVHVLAFLCVTWICYKAWRQPSE